jgi:hypothetical protein
VERLRAPKKRHSREKRNIGRRLEQVSEGKVIFLMGQGRTER